MGFNLAFEGLRQLCHLFPYPVTLIFKKKKSKIEYVSQLLHNKNIKEGNQINLISITMPIFSRSFDVFPYVSPEFERSTLIVPFEALER